MSTLSLTDPVASFRIELEERGDACVMVPVERHDEARCAAVTQARPESFASMGNADVTVVGTELVRADGWTYMATVLRERRPGLHEVDARGAERNADDFVALMRAPPAAGLKREGLVELTRINDVQVVRFELAGALAPVDHGIIALVVADDCAYTIQLVGPSAHARELREVADASLRTLQATPPRGSPAFRAGTAIVRVAAVGFLVCLALAALVFFTRRSRRTAR
jgi:hypothetical protein